MCTRIAFLVVVLSFLLAPVLDVAHAQMLGDADLPDAKALGNFAAVPNPTDSIFRVNCKVFSTFPGFGTVVGSGTLIGPKHLITAGHLVFYNGTWASDIEVVPAYTDGERPYGSAHNVSGGSYSWPGWVNNTSYDHNIGFVVLDRPLGEIAGHFLYDTNDNNSFFTTTLFNNVGYPGGTGFDGGNMYLWYGIPDEATDYVALSHSLSSSGMGGAALYRSLSGVRTVYGVLSHTIGQNTGFVRLTSGKKANIDTIIEDAYSDSLELVAADMQSPVDVAEGGDTIPGMSWLLYNDSAPTFSALVSGEVYMSTNSVITNGDTLLGSFQSSVAALSQGTSARIFLPDITLGNVDSAGTYYLGVIANIADTNTSNNATTGIEAFPIELGLNRHSADRDKDGVISLSELLRVIQLFTLGELHCDALGEDGYQPGAGAHNCAKHDSDFQVTDWTISLGELLRLVQMHNNGFYYSCDTGEDGFCTTLLLP